MIKRGVGVGQRNAGCGLDGRRGVCTREMCPSHLKSVCRVVGRGCSSVLEPVLSRLRAQGSVPNTNPSH